MSALTNKKRLIGAVAALFLGAGVFTATSLTQKEQISDLTLANIEAMTFDPDDIIVVMPCPGPGTKCTFRCVSGTDVGTCTIEGYRN